MVRRTLYLKQTGGRNFAFEGEAGIGTRRGPKVLTEAMVTPLHRSALLTPELFIFLMP
jgi:hypothetical protein